MEEKVPILQKLIKRTKHGLQAVLLRSKATQSEEIILILKAQFPNYEVLAAAKLGWQVEFHTLPAGNVIVLRILAFGHIDGFTANEVYLNIYEERDYKIMNALLKQDLLPIYFFDLEDSFQVAVSLQNTPNRRERTRIVLQTALQSKNTRTNVTNFELATSQYRRRRFIAKDRDTRDARLGDLLVIQKVITQEQLDAALAKQKEQVYKTPLGELLVIMGFCKYEDIMLCLFEQKEKLYRAKRLGSILLRDGILDEGQLQIALKEQEMAYAPIGQIFLRQGHITPMQLERAIRRQRQERSSGENMGGILVKAKIISRDDLERALAIQRTRYLPLGEVLVEHGFCTHSDVVWALEQQLQQMNQSMGVIRAKMGTSRQITG